MCLLKVFFLSQADTEPRIATTALVLASSHHFPDIPKHIVRPRRHDC